MFVVVQDNSCFSSPTLATLAVSNSAGHVAVGLRGEAREDLQRGSSRL